MGGNGDEVLGGYENGYEYVDLGLSVYWATCNVGASSPTNYGGYYNWGGKSNKGPSDYYPGNMNLPISYDTARNLMGGNWRMPTQGEQKELINACTRTWTNINGVNGYLLTSNINSQSVFLPAAGCYYTTTVRNTGSEGHYWSSTYHNMGGGRRIYFSTTDTFNADSATMTSTYMGYSVRAVLDK